MAARKTRGMLGFRHVDGHCCLMSLLLPVPPSPTEPLQEAVPRWL